MWKKYIFLLWWVFSRMISYEIINKVIPVLRIIQVKIIFYPVISLCPALDCVQFYTVSSTLLCPTKYCVHNYPKGLLFPFTFKCAAVVSCCAWEAPKFIFKRKENWKNNFKMNDWNLLEWILDKQILRKASLFCQI